jgi:hypothetical protein
MCNTYNITIVAGDILARTMTFTAEDDTPYAIDIYDEITMHVRRNYGADTLLASGSLAAGNFVVSGDDNNVLEISGIEMPSAPGTYVYDIEFSAADIRETLVRGSIKLLPQVTILEGI